MNINPFIEFISSLINLYRFALIAWIVMYYLIEFNIVNPYQPFVKKVSYTLEQLVEPVLKRLRKIIPSIGFIDLSPIILFLLLDLVQRILFSYLYKI